jgi:hypothetical protein
MLRLPVIAFLVAAILTTATFGEMLTVQRARTTAQSATQGGMDGATRPQSTSFDAALAGPGQTPSRVLTALSAASLADRVSGATLAGRALPFGSSARIETNSIAVPLRI